MSTQPFLVGLEVPTSPPGPRPRRRALTFREAKAWASRQVPWIAARARLHVDSELFLYMQAAKLVEEVGELHAQLLGRSRAQRVDRERSFDAASLEDEFADVAICLMILADVADVDLATAVRAKMQAVDRRVAEAG